MAYMDYLILNGMPLPFPDSYQMSLRDVESDANGETEAGTTQRDIIREGVVELGVEFTVSSAWLKKLSDYKKLSKITVAFFDTALLQMRETEMYMDGFQAKLLKDTSRQGLWKVSFSLCEL